MADEMPIKFFSTASKLEVWLEKQHAKSNGVWLKFYKKASGKKTVIYKEALDTALCYGWIDSQTRSLDAEAYLQKFTPRRSKSKWSKINREHIARLIKEKRMRPAGLLEVERAKSDGRWDAAYASPKDIQMTPEFANALKQSPKAKKFYDTLKRVNTYAILWRIHTAKTAEGRAKRVIQIIDMLEAGKTFH
jgi:uncharacterized protein YdeI (YjbR/CyaY-like superfamily)